MGSLVLFLSHKLDRSQLHYEQSRKVIVLLRKWDSNFQSRLFTVFDFDIVVGGGGGGGGFCKLCVVFSLNLPEIIHRILETN